MANYKFFNPTIGLPVIGQTDTAAKAPVGFVAEAQDPALGYGEFIYTRGGSASNPGAGDLAFLQPGGAVQAASGGTAAQGPVGLVAGALSASNVYGWAQIYGNADYANLATAGTGAVGAPLYIGSTAGRAQTTASATGFRIDGAYISQYSTTANSNSGGVQLYWPVYNGR